MKIRLRGRSLVRFHDIRLIASALFLLAYNRASLGAAQDKLKEEAEGFAWDSASLIVIGVMVLLLLIGIFWMMLISRRQAKKDRLEAERFELEALNVVARAEQSAASDEKAEPQSPAEWLIARLAEAKLVRSRDGGFSFGKGEQLEEALLITLNDNRRALVFNSLPPSNELQQQLRRGDLALIPGEGDEAVVVTSFSDFIANQFRR
jgi:hypothetical protein